MKNTGLFLVGGGLLAYYLITKKADIATLQYQIIGVDVGFNGIVPRLTLKLLINNPSNSRFKINSIVGTVRANGQFLGTVQSFEKVEILPTSQTPYNINFSISLIGIGEQIISIIQQKTGGNTIINFNGYINASGMVNQINLDYQL